MAQTTLVVNKQLTRKRRPQMRIVKDVQTTPQREKKRIDLVTDHKFFLNTLFCEMIEKI